MDFVGHVEGTIDLGQDQGQGSGKGQSQGKGPGKGQGQGNGKGSGHSSVVIRFLSDLRHREYYQAIAQVPGLVLRQNTY